MPDTYTPEPYISKMSARFDTFDINHDGYVTIEDFEAMARRILVAYDLSDDSKKAIDLLDGARKFYSGLAVIADENNDGKIMRDEFVSAAVEKLLNNPDGIIEIVRPFNAAVAAVADADDNGSVDHGEWARMLVTMGAIEEGAARWAARLDTDGDGAITVQELLDAAVSFYGTDNPHDEFG